MAEFTTTEVSGIASAVKWMRFPMESEGDSGSAYVGMEAEDDKPYIIEYHEDWYADYVGIKDHTLAIKLAKAKPGSGHDCFLKSIVVHFEAEAPHYWWNQAQRYHFWDIASSTSKMHSIHKGDIGDKCSKWISDSTIELVNNLIWMYTNVDPNDKEEWDCKFREIMCFEFKESITKEELFECILDNTPLGYQLKAGMVTNYLQLKTVYAQRKSHKLSHWSTDFTEWVKSLPMSYLITGED